MITTAHEDIDLEYHVNTQINNKDIKLELQVDRAHIKGGFYF